MPDTANSFTDVDLIFSAALESIFPMKTQKRSDFHCRPGVRGRRGFKPTAAGSERLRASPAPGPRSDPQRLLRCRPEGTGKPALLQCHQTPSAGKAEPAWDGEVSLLLARRADNERGSILLRNISGRLWFNLEIPFHSPPRGDES